jgi:hypothetical protein
MLRWRAKNLQEVSLQGDTSSMRADVGAWKLTWNADKARVIVKNRNTRKECSIYSAGEALPNIEFHRVINRNMILVYGETVVSELALVDLDSCKIKKYSPGLSTKITDMGYRSRVYCGDSAYPPSVIANNVAECESAKVYRLNPAKRDFVIDESLSRFETLKETGLELFGPAKIRDPGKASQKLVN